MHYKCSFFLFCMNALLLNFCDSKKWPLELRYMHDIADPQAHATLPPEQANSSSMSINVNPDSLNSKVDDYQKSKGKHC